MTLRQEGLCELAADARIPDDCLFLVFEEDFRFEQPAGEIETEEAYRASRSLLQDYKQLALDSLEGIRPPPPESTRPTSHQYGNMNNQPKEVWTRGLSQYLEDMVRYATACHRQNVGDVIWCGWVPGGPGSNPKRKASIGFGSHFLMVSKRGFATLRRDFVHHEHLRTPTHIDLALKKWMIETWRDSRACYLWPAIGNYTAHISGCSKEYMTTVRPSGWGDKWTRQGTRKSHDPKGRTTWITGFSATGGPEWLSSVDVETDVALDRWITEWDGSVDLQQLFTASSLGAAKAVRGHEPAALAPTAEAAESSSSSSTSKRAKRELRRRAQTLREFRCWREAGDIKAGW